VHRWIDEERTERLMGGWKEGFVDEWEDGRREEETGS
jgi:hypothetical protein